MTAVEGNSVPVAVGMTVAIREMDPSELCCNIPVVASVIEVKTVPDVAGDIEVVIGDSSVVITDTEVLFAAVNDRHNIVNTSQPTH